jgi:hypothetical protein
VRYKDIIELYFSIVGLWFSTGGGVCGAGREQGAFRVVHQQCLGMAVQEWPVYPPSRSQDQRSPSRMGIGVYVVVDAPRGQIGARGSCMCVTRIPLFTGQVHSRELPVIQEQLAAWRGGACIQVVMPHLSPVDREFIMTGTTAEEWQAVFGTTGAVET